MTTTKNRIILYIIAGLAAILIIGSVIVTTSGGKTDSPAKLLSLGEKYLLELDYENAIVQFLKVIEVEPMNERAYAAAAEAYIGLGQNDKAIAILEQGLAALPDSGALQQRLTELQPQEPEPEPQSSETPVAESEPEPVLTPEQAILKSLYEQALTMNMDAAMELFLTPEFIAMVQAAPVNEHGYPTLEYDGIYAYFIPGDNPYMYVMFGPGSETSDGIEHIVHASFNEDIQIWRKAWTTRTYANGDLNGPYEQRSYYPLAVENGVTLHVNTGNSLDGFKHGEEIQVWDVADGRVETFSKTFVNGMAQITGTANSDGSVPIGIDLKTGEPSLYTRPEYDNVTKPETPW